MPDHGRFIAENRAMWDNRAPVHAASHDYDLAAFHDDPAHLSTVVAFDGRWLGDLRGRSAVHLQCHIGTDTVSLARLEARPVVGLDMSPASVDVARQLADQAGTDVEFVVGEVADAPDLLGGRTFDLVYTGVGALMWLPDIAAWAAVVADLLAPGGTLFVRDAHPALMAVDDERHDEELVLVHPWFEHVEPVTWNEGVTYVDVDEESGNELTAMPSHEWNHGLGEIVTALLERGLVLEHLGEHTWADWQPWDLWEPVADGFWALPTHLRDRLPAMFSLRATRPTTRVG